MEAFSELFGELTLRPLMTRPAFCVGSSGWRSRSASTASACSLSSNTELGPVGELPAGVELRISI